MSILDNEKVTDVAICITLWLRNCFLVFIAACFCYVGYGIVIGDSGLDSTPLQLAVMQNDMKEVSRLVEGGAPIDQTDINEATPLMIAVNLNHDDAASYLIYRGASVEGTLSSAILNENLVIANMIISKGGRASPDSLAAYSRINAGGERYDPQLIDLLLNYGADINHLSYEGTSPNDGYTALGYAVISEDLNLTKYLVEKGADVNAPMSFGATPVERAEELDLNEYGLFGKYGSGAMYDEYNCGFRRVCLYPKHGCAFPEIISFLRQHGAH